MRAKRTIVQKIVKEFNKGLRRIYYYNYTKIKYFYLSAKFFFLNKKITNHNISLLLPTRERSDKFNRMLESLKNTCHDLSRIEILILIDTDDKNFHDYEKIINDNKSKIKINFFVKDFKTHAIRNNFLANNCSGDLLFPINDDMVFVSKNWDLQLDTEFSKNFNNKPFCLWIDAGNRYKYFHCDFPIVNRNWYKRLGYIGSEYFNFWYLDSWICELSRRSNTFLLSYKIIVKQFSAHSNENEVDNTHLKNIRSGDQAKDDIIWLETQNKRIMEAKKLL
tara:strand:- start:147 stop:980 length:834 start_codon:yes stop_codon:yes gene_type:complete